MIRCRAQKLPPGLGVFHRTFHIPDTNEKIPTAVLAIGTKNIYLYNKSVMVLEGISSLENANIFFPKSFSEAPI
jgi:hypothetical protein